MRLPIKLFCFIALICVSTISNATDTFKKLSTEQQQRANSLYEIVRCPVCNGQSLSGSEASIAQDLKHIIQTKIHHNLSDAQIKSDLVAMYGQDILFEPPSNGKTFLLNYGVYLGLGIIFAVFLYRHHKKHTHVTAQGHNATPPDTH